MWELDYKESWTLNNWCFWIVVLEKTLESPLDCKEIQSVHPKGNKSWIFIGRTDTEAESPILWPIYGKNWLSRKVPDAGKDWRQEEKGKTEDETVWWHHRLYRHVWVSSRSWWWTGKPGMGQSMGLQSDTTERQKGNNPLQCCHFFLVEKLRIIIKIIAYHEKLMEA